MAKVKKVTVDTLEAIAVAILAYRANNHLILREVAGNNKEIIHKYFTTDLEIAGLEEARLEAKSIRDALNQRVMMNTLMGVANNDFLASVNSICQSETVHSDKFGILAWAPKLYADTVESDNARERLLGMGIDSDYVGRVGKKIEFTYNEVMCKYLQYYNSFAHHGHDGHGNLITFFKQERIADGSKLVARVKSHRQDPKLGNGKFTVVHYVKVVNEE